MSLGSDLLAHHLFLDHPRPDEVLGPQHGERPGHLFAGQIALIPHQVLQQRHLRLRHEERQLARLGEIDLGGQQRHGGEPRIPAPRHRRRLDRQQRPAEAIARGMHALGAGDRLNRVERHARALLDIILHAEIAIRRVRVAPRDHEHGIALPHQPAHQRIMLREIEDVVFHDPGRHDQDRLGMHGLGGRAVLDQLGEMAARDHLAGRRGEPVTDGQLGRRSGIGPGRGETLDGVHQPLKHACAMRLARMFDDVGVEIREIARGDRVERLPHGKAQRRLVARRHAAHIRRGLLPPRLGQQKAVAHRRIGQLAPEIRRKAPVRLHRCRRAEPGRVGGDGRGRLERVLGELGLLAGRDGQMDGPVRHRPPERRGREPAGHVGDHHPRDPVGKVVVIGSVPGRMRISS